MNDAARVNRAIARMVCVCVPMTWAVGPGWYEPGLWPIIFAMPQSRSRVVIPLLDWLLRAHPDTPKNRAKQWILAGRVSVNGVVIRKPHQTIADPGDTLELGDRHATTLACGSGWQIHPRVSLLYLDSACAIVNKGPGLISVPAPNCNLSALSILADFLVGKLKARDRGGAGKSLPPAYRRHRFVCAGPRRNGISATMSTATA